MSPSIETSSTPTQGGSLDFQTPFDEAAEATLPAMVEAFAAVLPDQLLVATDTREMTAVEFRDACRALASRLRAAGLQTGDSVGVLLPNGWQWLLAVQAAAYAGLIAVPLNTWYKAAELASSSTQTRLRTIITQPVLRERDNAQLLHEAGLLDENAESGYLGALLWHEGEQFPRALPLADSHVDHTAVSGEDVAMYVFTSGSSAEPKVVVLLHRDMIRNGYQMGLRQQAMPGDRLWLGTPLFFGYGCTNAVTVCLTHGATLCLQERFDAVESARFIEKLRCTIYYGLGPITGEFVKSDAHNRFDLSSLRTGAIGLTAEEKRLAVETLGVTQARSMYGLTECYGLCAMSEPDDSIETVLHTQGRALPNHKIRCVEVETGLPLPYGEGTVFGEIQLHGCVTPRYLDNDLANSSSFTADGWFRTGDLGWMDCDERLHFAGRLKEVVKINGITVSPAETEIYVLEHPDIAEAYAFGWKAGTRGEEVLCCGVVLTPTSTLESDEVDLVLKRWLKQRISSYKVPATFVLLVPGRVPTTATGKVSKRLIGEQYISGASRSFK